MAFFEIAEDKAPGPDGYSSGFYKAAWSIVGEEVVKAIMEFFITGRLLKQVNATILALIPKVWTPSLVSDFCPIFCCNVLYKVITKIILQRLRMVLDSLISPSQNAFVLGRSIGDNILLAQELFTRYNQQRLPMRCALKVDQRKAYDMVEWDFLFAVLQMFGFLSTFINWIEECATTPMFSVCINGNPHDFFKGARGLRQGARGLNPWDPRSIACSTRISKGPPSSAVSWTLSLGFEIIISGLGPSNVGHPKVAWHLACRPIEEGGQGIRDILALNKALMSRHLWNVIKSNRASIWVNCIFHIRLRDKSIWTVNDKSGSWGWRKMLRLQHALLPHIDFKVGDGDLFSLWHNPWHSLGPLISRFPRDPGLTNMPVIAKLSMVINNGEWGWPPITDMECIEIIHNLPDLHNGNDSITWRSNGDDFTTSAVYDVFHHPGPKVGWSSLLLGTFKIPRHHFILWLAVLEKLSTFDKPWLQHLGNDCVLCKFHIYK
ncbi:UNVERIFIED_CONTAM: Transposon TX1 uncharacterized protein [Sesamum latifolium]|uniref:Transposon TX1 uncharacterized protein n=1 Tax=Sesamum latifolium TaxID=2727402 RepID=A0AAW2XMF7_9LAMI